MDDAAFVSIVSGMHNCGSEIGHRVAHEYLAENGPLPDYCDREFSYQAAKWCSDRIKKIQSG